MQSAHEDEDTRANVKHTAKQKLGNPTKEPLKGTPLKERKPLETDPDPAGSAALQTSCHTKKSDLQAPETSYLCPAGDLGR